MAFNGLYSYKEVSDVIGKTTTYVANIVFKLQLKKFSEGCHVFLPQESFDAVLAYKPKVITPFKHHRRKITIIETYDSLRSEKAVSRTLRINRHSVKVAVKEWKETGHVTVESKINYGAKTYTGVYLRGKKWVYEIKVDKVKHYKGGFKTEEEAFEALCAVKESLKNG